MTISMHVISTSDMLNEIEDLWNQFINENSGSPWLLSTFTGESIESARLEGWTPMILVVSADNKIVGIFPLKTKKKLGLQLVSFLYKSWFSPDFINDLHYQELCVAYILNFLFKTLHCQLADLTLPAESPSMQLLEKKCKDDGIDFYAIPEKGRCILRVDRTWAEFERFRGRNFRQKIKKIERNLDRLGSWTVICVEEKSEKSGVIQKILDVERMSWKEEHRVQMRVKSDEDLMMVWNGSQHLAEIEPDFKWSVWFLELNGQTLAYLLVLQYKEVAYFAKTSYDERYRKFYPGIYALNAAIRDFFNKQQIRKIDFSTDLPFHRTWTQTCLPRVRVLMSKKTFLSTLVRFTLANVYSKRILGSILGPLSRRAHSLVELFGQ